MAELEPVMSPVGIARIVLNWGDRPPGWLAHHVPAPASWRVALKYSIIRFVRLVHVIHPRVAPSTHP